MASEDDTPATRLERQLEQALRAGRSKSFLLPQLEQLEAIAPHASPAWCFANRTLAELLIEQAPWRAALHARRVTQVEPNDEAAHALLGLAHAVQSNYRAAIASYRRALALDPRNPWYAHNIGHLFDVALDQPREGLPFLQRAHGEAPTQDDVASSLAHCLARLGQREEALEIASELAARRVDRLDFVELHDWVRRGDHRAPGAPALLAPTPYEPILDAAESVRALLERAPLDDDQREQAHAILERIEERGEPPTHDPPTIAAAIEYAVRRRTRRAPTQRELAERYAVSVQALREQVAAVRAMSDR